MTPGAVEPSPEQSDGRPSDPVLLAATVPAETVDDRTGRAWMAGAIGVAEEHVEGLDGVRLLVACPPEAQGAVAVALGGDATQVDSWTPVVKRVRRTLAGRHLDLDVPANVFGDGEHPTTATCLALIAELVPPASTVLDLGCGAGLLAVEAALRGASVTAVDVWEPAVVATRTNAARAGVAGRVVAEVRSVTGDDRADLVLANIGAATLLELAPAVLAATDGPIVLSGLLEAQVDEVVTAYTGTDGSRGIGRRIVVGDWATVLLTATRP